MWAAAAGFCGLGVLSSAIASPPLSRARSAPSTIDSAPSILGSFAHQEHSSTARLDLRVDPLRATHDGVTALASTRFPSLIHHLDLGKADLGADDRVQLPGLGASELGFRMMSKPEILVRRIHQEGLPIARLWESKSALLSIGLNQRGKPGLWLTQKIH
jgi:hypothetical protein